MQQAQILTSLEKSREENDQLIPVDGTRTGHFRESQLIISLSQTRITAPCLDVVGNLLQQDLDWDYLSGITARNAVFPIFARNLLTHFSDLLPDEIRTSFDQRFRHHRHQNMFWTSKLIEIVQLLKENNIPAIPFKGPLLAMQAYGDVALRKYGDLDVLVQPKHFYNALEILKSRGYVAVTELNWLNRNDWYISRKKDIYLTNQERTVNLELHWKLSGSHFSLPIEMSRLWENPERVLVAGTELNTLKFNDLLIYLCLHGSRHSWERFGWICDAHELIRSKDEINWEEITQQAKRLGCENILELALRLLNDYFGLETDIANWENIKSDKRMEADLSDIRQRLFSPERITVKIGERYQYHLKLKERRLDKLKLHIHYILWYLKIILKPNELDHNLFNLPGFLAPLYYVMRPFRLFYTFVIPQHSRKE